MFLPSLTWTTRMSESFVWRQFTYWTSDMLHKREKKRESEREGKTTTMPKQKPALDERKQELVTCTQLATELKSSKDGQIQRKGMFTASNQYIKSSLTGRRLEAGIPSPILKKSIVRKHEVDTLWLGTPSGGHVNAWSPPPTKSHKYPTQWTQLMINPPAPNSTTCQLHVTLPMCAGQQSTRLTKSTKDYILCSINTLLHTSDRCIDNWCRWICINRKTTLVHSHRDRESKSRKTTEKPFTGRNAFFGQATHANLRNRVHIFTSAKGSNSDWIQWAKCQSITSCFQSRAPPRQM